MITVIGKFQDTSQYIGVPGYNTMPFDPLWDQERNIEWLDESIRRGDKFLIASNDYTGEFRNELIYLLQRLIDYDH